MPLADVIALHPDILAEYMKVYGLSEDQLKNNDLVAGMYSVFKDKLSITKTVNGADLVKTLNKSAPGTGNATVQTGTQQVDQMYKEFNSKGDK